METAAKDLDAQAALDASPAVRARGFHAISGPWAALALAWATVCVWGHLPFSLWLVRQREAPWGTWAFRQAVPGLTLLAVLLLCAWLWHGARAAAPQRRWRVLACWVAWICACWMIDRWLTFTVNEYAHYPQYALLCWLLGKALDAQRSRWPVMTIVGLTTLAGTLDETLQYLWTTRNYSHYLDFNDLLVNLVAAWGGVMLYYGFAVAPPPRARACPSGGRGRARRAAAAAVLALGLAVSLWAMQRSCECVRLTPAVGQTVASGGIEGGVLYLQRAPGWYGQWHDAPRHGRYHVLHPEHGLLLMLLTLVPLAVFAQAAALRLHRPHR